jgi:hypothetical protein
VTTERNIGYVLSVLLIAIRIRVLNQQKQNFAPKIKFPLKLKLVKNVGTSSLNRRSMFWATDGTI